MPHSDQLLNLCLSSFLLNTHTASASLHEMASTWLSESQWNEITASCYYIKPETRSHFNLKLRKVVQVGNCIQLMSKNSNGNIGVQLSHAPSTRQRSDTSIHHITNCNRTHQHLHKRQWVSHRSGIYRGQNGKTSYLLSTKFQENRKKHFLHDAFFRL